MDLRSRIYLILFRIYYDLFNYAIAFKNLFIEIMYKLHLIRHLDVHNELPKRLEDDVAIVTGGTRGLGLSVVRALVSKGCYVFVASSQSDDKFPMLIEKIYHNIPKVSESGVRRGTVKLEHLDLSSMDSVKRFVNAFTRTKRNLNYLICNAGIMFAPLSFTIDGFESHLAVNYLGHCLLTMELLPIMRATADSRKMNSRIVNVSSVTHFSTGFRFHDIRGNIYSSSQAYAQSKLAQIMFTYKLDRFLRNNLNCNNVQVFSLHPGVILSDLYEHVILLKLFPFLKPIVRMVLRDLDEGAETTLYATLSEELGNESGAYLEDCTIKTSSRFSLKTNNQERLWGVTNSLLDKWMPDTWRNALDK